MEEDQHRAGENQRIDAGPLGLLFDTFGRIGDEEGLEERIREMENRGLTGARRKEPKTKGKKIKIQLAWHGPNATKIKNWTMKTKKKLPDFSY